MELGADPLPGELELLAGMPKTVEGKAPFHVEVTEAPGGQSESLAADDSFESEFEIDGDVLRLTHRLFTIEIEAGRRRARVARAGGGGLALTHTIRASLLAVLPFDDGLALHSCGAVHAGRALVFHGRSGAGKSTLASTCPWALLSDEIVVLRRDPNGWKAYPSGFWGGARPMNPASEPARLTAVITLAKGPTYVLVSLSRAETIRGLTASVHVPPSELHWRSTLNLIGDLAASVPGARMEWAPAAPPWSQLESLL